MRLAIVILNWNGVQLLREYLPSVVKHAQEVPGACVYVADNASTDNSRKVLAEEFPDVQVIKLKRNYGFAEGYNRALAQVRAEYFLILNNDVRTTEGWLAPLLTYMDAHPDVAACQPKIRSVAQPSHFEFAGACGGWIDALGYPFCRGRMMNTVEEDRGQYDTVAEVFWATGAALLIRSTDYIEAAGFDTLFFAHQEEIDLCWRLQRRGRKIVCVPQSVVYHLGGGTLKKSSPRKTFLNFRNNLLMLYKNLPDDRLVEVMERRRLLDFMAAMKFLLTGSPREFAAVIRARKDYNRILRKYPVREHSIGNKKLAGLYSKSMIMGYYFKGLRTFADGIHE